MFNLVCEGQEIKVKGILYHFGNKAYGTIAKKPDYITRESRVMKVHHVNYNPAGIKCYWLESFGLDSWCIESC